MASRSVDFLRWRWGGSPRSEATEQNGRTATLRDRMHRQQQRPVDQSEPPRRHSPGPTPALTEEQKAELKALVVQGPDPAVDNVVRWRCVDLRQKVADRFKVDVHDASSTRRAARLCRPRSTLAGAPPQAGCGAGGEAHDAVRQRGGRDRRFAEAWSVSAEVHRRTRKD